MDLRLIVLVAMNVLAAGLPLVGLGRLAFRARAEMRRAQLAEEEMLAQGAEPRETLPNGLRGARLADLSELAINQANRPWLDWKAVRVDLALVGGGILLGAIANVWSLLA